MDTRLDEVKRVLGRYLVEIVEAYDLCPWARATRQGGELAVEVLWGTPSDDAWVAAAQAALARPRTKIAMVVAPELACTPNELRQIRHRVGLRVTEAGIAEFHPGGPLDLETPARLVPFVRRSPDPLLQLVPHALLSSVRTPTTIVADLTMQSALLLGTLEPPKPPVSDRIAANNHERVSASLDAMTATLDAIAVDRAAAYARVGISTFLRRPG